MNRLTISLITLAVLVFSSHAEEPPRRKNTTYPPVLEGAQVETYKEIDGATLKVWIFQPPEKPAPGAKRAAIVFFFGGGWTNGSPSQFEPQCRHFAERGMVAITADYRVASRQHVKVAACVADAKSCIRWVRKHAEQLGIDPDRVVASGGSAGGHLAAAVATLPGLDESGEDTSVSAVPNALVLFNPALVLAPFPGLDLQGFDKRFGEERCGCPAEAVSPLHHVAEHLPPTLILHGRADTTVPFATVEAFTAEMKKKGNRCDLVGFEGEKHGFFNNTRYNETLAEADKFLVSLGYLPPQKTAP
jgi:acetyl esterase/lipase